VAPPSAEKPTQDERGKDGHRKENETRVEVALIQRVHGLGRFNRRDRSSRDPPVDEMRDDKQVDTISTAARRGPFFDLRTTDGRFGRTVSATSTWFDLLGEGVQCFVAVLVGIAPLAVFPRLAHRS
jgi:hypothetical protein